ncbi:signal peptidase I [Saliphagus sp. GCM10025334]
MLALVVLLTAVMVVGHLIGTPVAFGYVETGSMAPALEAGDGFVAIPSAIAGPVEPGDVVVYEARTVEGGGLTTHRVVEEREHGYVTRGDANPFTDQDGGEPHVTDGQVVAKAWQVNGDVVTIPQLGTTVMALESGLESIQWRLATVLGTTAVVGTEGLALLLLGVGIVSIGLSLGTGADRTNRNRTRTRSRSGVFDGRTLVLGLAVVLCLVTLGTLAASAGTTEIGIVSAEFESEHSNVIPMGETEVATYELHNAGVLPVVTVLEPASDGIAVDAPPDRLHRGESVEATVAITAPPETGYYLRSFAEYRYFAVLPTSIVLALHAVHPWVAMVAVTGVTVALFVLPFALLIGTGTIRTRRRARRTTRSRRFDW